MNAIFSAPSHKRRLATLLMGSLIAFVAACSGNSAVPVSAPANPTATKSVVIPNSGVTSDDTTSILKLLTKDVVIGSTVDPTNGDSGPRSVEVVKANYGLKKGQLVVCNFADKTGAAGKGTTVDILNPQPGSSPSTFVQSSKIEGCDGDATTLGNDVVVSALSGGVDSEFANNGKLFKTYGSPLKAPLSDIEASCSTFALGIDPAFFCGYSAEYIFTSDSVTGGIVSYSINNYGNPKPLEVATGFAVNKGTGWNVLGPSGLAYYGKTDSLYVADGVDNTVVYFTHASELLVKDEIVVQPGGKTFKCKYPGGKNPCGKLVLAGKPLNAPSAMAVLPNGNLIVANTADAKVIEMTPKGQILDTRSIVKVKGGVIYGLAAIGKNDSNTALYYTNKDTNTLHELEQ